MVARNKGKANGLVNNLPKPPKFAEWGWNDTPLCTRILTLGAFFNLVCLATPFWAYVSVSDVSSEYSTFGLWHYCGEMENECESIHTNLVPGKSVPGRRSLLLLRLGEVQEKG